jgi:hypothetical protein
MKRPKPRRPTDAPEGTKWFGGPISWFSIALIIRTEAVSIDRLSALLRCQPTDCWQKGVPLFRVDGSLKRTPKFSSWRLQLKPDETDEWNMCEAAKLLLGRMNGDVVVWREITSDGDAHLLFGLSMDQTNRGFVLDTELIRFLADRGIRADFDIYAEEFDLPSAPPLA